MQDQPSLDAPALDVLALDGLSQDRTWRGLLGYTAGSSGVSDIVTPEFFLSPDGSRDAAAELTATVAAMQAPIGSDPDQHAQCRFPGRFLWLRRQHLVPTDTPHLPCPQYQAWLGTPAPTGASVIFASGHLSNPATFYGHMLLRLTSEGASASDALTETTLNYGAISPPDENPVLYIARGLSGQYDATFSGLEFYRHLHEYTEISMRDVWEYKLDLTVDQTAMLAAHSWEILRVHNHYFYLSENCAFKIAELVGVALDEPVDLVGKPWVMPVDVLDSLIRARNGDGPLVTSTVRLDSRQTRLRQNYLALTPRERGRVQAFLKAPQGGVEPHVSDLDPDSQVRVLQTLIDFFSVGETATAEGSTEARQIRRNLLLARLDRPVGQARFEGLPAPVAPHLGQKSSLFQASLLDNSELGQGGEIRFRAAYNDFLSITPGALPYSELSFADIRVDLHGDQLSLRSLEAVRITSLNISQTGLPEDGGLAWRVRIGAEQETLSCRTCLNAYLEGNVGKAAWVGQAGVAYALVGARVVGPDAMDGALHLGATSGIIMPISQRWRAQVEVGTWQDLNGDDRLRTVARAETRFMVGRGQDISLELLTDDTRGQSAMEIRAGFSTYW